MAGLNLQLSPLTLPFGTEFPGTPQELLSLIAAYMQVIGAEGFIGVAYGDTEPAPADRGLWWARTDGSGNPLGWYAWDGAAWSPIPIILPSGPTSSRPSAPTNGTEYLDTDIDVVLVYLNGQWVTAAGSPGDIKIVTGTVLADVLTKNPGWSQYTEGIGKVLAGAATDGSDAETDVGADTLVLTEDQLPAHKHTDIVLTGSEADSGDAGNLAIVAATQSVGLRTITASETGFTGAGADIDNRQATRLVFCLVKD